MDALAAAWATAIEVLEAETMERAPLAPWIALRELGSEAERATETTIAARFTDATHEECFQLALAEYHAALAHSVASLVALALAARRRSGKHLILAALD
jgi:hypothetical protein